MEIGRGQTCMFRTGSQPFEVICNGIVSTERRTRNVGSFLAVSVAVAAIETLTVVVSSYVYFVHSANAIRGQYALEVSANNIKLIVSTVSLLDVPFLSSCIFLFPCLFVPVFLTLAPLSPPLLSPRSFAFFPSYRSNKEERAVVALLYATMHDPVECSCPSGQRPLLSLLLVSATSGLARPSQYRARCYSLSPGLRHTTTASYQPAIKN